MVMYTKVNLDIRDIATAHPQDVPLTKLLVLRALPIVEAVLGRGNG